MTELPDIFCPACRARHGPAAKVCECGQSLVVEQPPAPPWVFFTLAAFFTAVTFGSAHLASRNGLIYLPIGSILFTSASVALGVKSWLWHLRQRPPR